MNILRRHYARSVPGRQDGGRASSLAHKFKLGQEVRFLRNAALKLSKEIEQSLFVAPFEVSRLLPAVGNAFQYRVRNRTTGQERVADEAEIVAINAENDG